jgi:hypothetical protein
LVLSRHHGLATSAQALTAAAAGTWVITEDELNTIASPLDFVGINV